MVQFLKINASICNINNCSNNKDTNCILNSSTSVSTYVTSMKTNIGTFITTTNSQMAAMVAAVTGLQTKWSAFSTSVTTYVNSMKVISYFHNYYKYTISLAYCCNSRSTNCLLYIFNYNSRSNGQTKHRYWCICNDNKDTISITPASNNHTYKQHLPLSKLVLLQI